MDSVEVAELSRVELIARGGSASVYSALRMTHGDKVAVKVLSYPVSAQGQGRSYYERELRSLERLRNVPGVVAALDSGITDDGYPYMTMPLMMGGAGSDRMSDAGMEWRQAAEIVSKVARSVQGAHDLGIWHRDIKPANILFTANDEPFIADFGIARLLDTAGATVENACTPEYAAPEALDGNHQQSSDVYSLGATLVALITGRSPFSDHDGGVLTTMHRVLTEAPPDLAALGHPGDLAALANAALAKDPNARPQSPAHFADMLDAVIARPRAQSSGRSGRVVSPITVVKDPSAQTTHGLESTDGRPGAKPVREPDSIKGMKRLWPLVAAALLVVVGLTVAALARGSQNEVADQVLTATEVPQGQDQSLVSNTEAPRRVPVVAVFSNFAVLGHGDQEAPLGDHGALDGITFRIEPDEPVGDGDYRFFVELMSGPGIGTLIDRHECATGEVCTGTLTGSGFTSTHWIVLREVADQDRRISLTAVAYDVVCSDGSTISIALGPRGETAVEPCAAVETPAQPPTVEAESVPNPVDVAIGVECSADIGPWIGVDDIFQLSAVARPVGTVVSFGFEYDDESGILPIATGSYRDPGKFTPVVHWEAGDQSGMETCAEFTVIEGWTVCTADQEPISGVAYQVDPNLADNFLAIRSEPGAGRPEVGRFAEGTRSTFFGCLRSGTSVWWQSDRGWSAASRIGVG